MAGSQLARGAVASPNIWGHRATYEIENRAFDPERRVEAAMARIAPLDGDLLDLGCGTGFHLPFWAQTARSVIGVEPHAGLAAVAGRRTRGLDQVRVLVGAAQAIPLPDDSIDVVQARWAYFFGRGCEPGLAELARVLRRGGTAFVIDNDASRSEFGHWFRRGFPHLDSPADHERFWARQGWSREPVLTRWSFATRADLEAVLRIELPPHTAEEALAAHQELSMEYAVNLWWRRFR